VCVCVCVCVCKVDLCNCITVDFTTGSSSIEVGQYYGASLDDRS